MERARAPFSQALFSPGVVAVADAFIVLGLPCAESSLSLEAASCPAGRLEAARYSPARNAWESLPAPPIDLPESAAIGATGIGVRGHIASFEVGIPTPILLYNDVDATWVALPRAAGIVDPYCGLPDGRVVAVGGGEVSSQDPEVAEINTYFESDEHWMLGPRDPPLPGLGTRRVACGRTATAVLENSAEPNERRMAWLRTANRVIEWEVVSSPVAARAFVAVGENPAGVRVLAAGGVPNAGIYVMAAGDTTWVKVNDDIATVERVVAAGESLLLLDVDEKVLRLWELV